MSYENAPVTKMMATHCCACGKSLANSKSLEAVMGPDCRAKYAVTVDVTEAANDEANVIMHRLAKLKRFLDRADVIAACERLRELGFVSLADRVLLRFETSFAEIEEERAAAAKASEVEIIALRAEYARIRAFFCYDSCTEPQFNEIVRSSLGDSAGPADFVAAAKTAEIKCSACGGTGAYHGHHDGGECYRCHGKGFQRADDVARNRAYDALNRRKAS